MKEILLDWAPSVLPPLALLAGLIYVIWIDPYIGRERRRIMLILVGLVMTILLQDLLNELFTSLERNLARTLTDIYGYTTRPAILALFFYLVRPRRRYWGAWVLVGINGAIHLTALFSPICFSIEAGSRFVRGPLGYSCHVVSGALLVFLLYLTFQEYNRSRRGEALLPLFTSLLILGAVALDLVLSAQPLPFLTSAMALSCVLYYIWLHLRFVREHEQALMAEQRIQIMMSQIQPHFLYNTLSTIQALCRIDPEMAFQTTERFGTYLRQNIDALSQPDRIPMEKELEHTRVYAEIESIRFPHIRVEYDTPDLDFTVPPLIIQPLVENAIRHGVRIREDGLVRVVTRLREGYHEILIEDNGKGFDVERALQADGSHIGLRNVRDRIASMCGGSLSVKSDPETGTAVTIRIPVSARQKNPQ